MPRVHKSKLEKEVERLKREIAENDNLMRKVLLKVESLQGHCLTVQAEVETFRRSNSERSPKSHSPPGRPPRSR